MIPQRRIKTEEEEAFHHELQTSRKQPSGFTGMFGGLMLAASPAASVYLASQPEQPVSTAPI